jgi:hypothetical protein
MTQKRMDDMEQDIRALKIRVNVLLILGILSFILTIAKLFIPSLSTNPAPPSNTNSVQIGGHKPTPQREYLSTDEVAEREGVSARTVTSWIEQSRIAPMPIKSDRAWIIDRKYKILPQITQINNN